MAPGLEGTGLRTFRTHLPLLRNLRGGLGRTGPMNQAGETQNRNVRLKSRAGRRGLPEEKRESGRLKARLAFFCLHSLGYTTSRRTRKVSLLKKSLLQEGSEDTLLSKTRIRTRRIYFKRTKGCQTIRGVL